MHHAQAFALGATAGVLIMMTAALVVLVRFVSADTERFRQFLEGI